MNLPPLRIAVVGAGLTGLAAAHRLLELSQQKSRPVTVQVFEAADRVGGLIGTRSIAGYTAELGADSFITNKPWALNLCRRLGLESRLIPTDATYRKSLVLHEGQPVPVPEGFQLLTPNQLWPILSSPIFTWRGKLQMALEVLSRKRKVQPDESLASFVRRHFGSEALERLIQPLVGGIYTSDPEKLSLAATLPRFLDMERDYGSLIRAMWATSGKQKETEAAQGARYGLFMTLAGGMGELFETLRNRVEQGATLELGTRVEQLARDPDTGELALRTSWGSAPLVYDRVLLCLPAYAIAELVPWAPALAQPLAEIPYASSMIVVSGYPLRQIKHPLDAFGLVIPTIAKRKILAVSFTSRKFPDRAPAGCVQIRTFVGGAMQPELCALPDADISRIVRHELQELLGVSGGPDFEVIARYPRSMPQYHVGHLDRVARIRAATADIPGLELAGNAYEGVGIPDSVRSAEAAAERCFAQI